MTIGNEYQVVALVDADDKEIGVAEKLDAHKNGGLLHRAFSIILLNDRCQMLLQRRASGKYHCPGMWSNSCCGHPRPGHDIIAEAEMRLQIEIGVTAEISHIGTISYRLPLDNGFTEWELDHVLVGQYSGPVTPNPAEVDDVRWISSHDLKTALKARSQSFTPWFPLILSKGISPSAVNAMMPRRKLTANCC